MDDKKMELFAGALMILWEGYCEQYGGVPIGSRVVISDEEEPSGVVRKVRRGAPDRVSGKGGEPA